MNERTNEYDYPCHRINNNMAQQGPPNHDVLDAVILCGVSNTQRAGIVGTDAERIAENVFNND